MNILPNVSPVILRGLARRLQGLGFGPFITRSRAAWFVLRAAATIERIEARMRGSLEAAEQHVRIVSDANAQLAEENARHCVRVVKLEEQIELIGAARAIEHEQAEQRLNERDALAAELRKQRAETARQFTRAEKLEAQYVQVGRMILGRLRERISGTLPELFRAYMDQRDAIHNRQAARLREQQDEIRNVRSLLESADARIEALKRWRIEVASALNRGGTTYEDVPAHIRALAAERAEPAWLRQALELERETSAKRLAALEEQREKASRYAAGNKQLMLQSEQDAATIAQLRGDLALLSDVTGWNALRERNAQLEREHATFERLAASEGAARLEVSNLKAKLKAYETEPGSDVRILVEQLRAYALPLGTPLGDLLEAAAISIEHRVQSLKDAYRTIERQAAQIRVSRERAEAFAGFRAIHRKGKEPITAELFEKLEDENKRLVTELGNKQFEFETANRGRRAAEAQLEQIHNTTKGYAR